MGTDQTRKLSSFGIAAVAFDQELQRFQQLTELARRTGLDSRKSLDKAAHAAEEATESHRRMAERMSTLAAEMQEVRDRNEKAVNDLNERKAEIAARMNEVGSLVERVNLLGKAATQVSKAVKRIGAGAKADAPDRDALEELGTLMKQMDILLEQARLLARTAHEAKLVELAAEIESIRQQIHAARNKMSLLHERLEQMLARPPTPRG
jgi:DNA repair exonuclease SbcCD ATPase subunit